MIYGCDNVFDLVYNRKKQLEVSHGIFTRIKFTFHSSEIGDPVRMGAQVISGIGFLGAGTIIVTGRNKITGITTAASLWAAACSGLAIGIGFYEGAVTCGVIIVFIMSGLQRFDVWTRKHSKYIDLYIDYNSEKGSFGEFLEYARENHFEVSNLQMSQNNFYHKEKGQQRILSVTMTVVSHTKRTHTEVIEVLSKEKGIQYIEEL